MGEWLKDKVAVITGSGQGIGRAIAIAMAQEGAKVVTNNRRAGNPYGDAETTAKEIKDMGGQAVPFFGDISKFDVAEKLTQTAVDKFGRLDILVNNAIVYTSNPVWEMTEEQWDNCLDVALKGSFNCTRHACVLMKEQKWGRILNATSGSWLGTFEFCNYGAAKAGIVGLTRSVARDMARFGVTCNTFAPAAATRDTLSESTKARWKRRYEAGITTKEQYERMSDIPLPETVPPLLLYLCTDEAANINGQVFYIRGGRIALYSTPKDENPIVKEEGLWTVDELVDLVPKIVLKGYKNPIRPVK